MDADMRRLLAIAFARDTVAAALASAVVREVVVVSNDADAGGIAALGAALVPDVPDAGLNPALRYAAKLVRSARPGAPLAAISSDLPALRGEDLTRALSSAPGDVPSFVADAQGVGTTMLASPEGREWKPRFGSRSRIAHRGLGFVELEDDGIERLRRDVDTADDLRAARRLGVGEFTAAALARSQRRGVSVTDVQGTVFDFDERDGSGSVVLDTGARLAFTADAFATSGLRFLRPGQRVRLEIAPDGAIASITIATLPAPGSSTG
jgi:2-phospho-L-lactate guanylyltransferase